MTTAIIVAAGSSRRMGFNKLLAPLAGEPVLRRTLSVFQKCPDIDEIIVVAGESLQADIQGWLGEGLDKVAKIIPGGAERHLSVHAGLQAVDPACEIVAVHDGARPLISANQISRCVEAARQQAAVACARPMTETLKRCDAG